MRAKKRGEEAYWNPVAFIATEKLFLLRSLQERGIQVSPKPANYIDAMPDTFREWLSWHELVNSNLPSEVRQTKPP